MTNIVRDDVCLIKQYIFKRFNLCLFILCEDHFTALYVNNKGKYYCNNPLGYKMNHKLKQHYATCYMISWIIRYIYSHMEIKLIVVHTQYFYDISFVPVMFI